MNDTNSISGQYNYTFQLPVSGGSSISSVAIADGTGLVYGIQSAEHQVRKGTRKRIGPKLYFNYVKSKLSKTQTKKLKGRLQKLQALVKNADAVGQKALYEELSRMLVVAVRESEAAACGYDVFVNESDVLKYMGMVSESDSSSQNPVHFRKLEDFTRSIPAKIQKKLKGIQEKGIFDEYYVLYLDYTKEVIKSTKEKIREKDPILFGKFAYDPERLYFIADWVDEYCDLTLSKFVDTLKAEDEEYETSKIGDVTPEYLERIKQEMKEREERLKNTNPRNFRDNMQEEENAAELRRLKEENQKLREDKRFADEDREIAIEDALKERERDRADWREQASKELIQLAEEKDQELTKRPWYKKLFK